MFTRTITINTNPATQCVLHYDTAENAHRSPVRAELSSRTSFIFYDDYNQQLEILDIKMIACDMITDCNESLRMQGNKKIEEMVGQDNFTNAVQADPELKAIFEKRMQAQAAAQALQNAHQHASHNAHQPKRRH